MTECIFCKIVTGDIPATKVYETDDFIAFRDIKPVYKTHVLVIPKIHIPDLNGIDDDNIDIIGEILLVGKKVAELEGLKEGGYRFVINCGEDAGMEVSHLHLHVLGGEKLRRL